MAAADKAGMPVSAWVEQALRQALEAKAEPAPPEGVEIDELEAMVRRVVAEELQPVKEALARPTATAPSRRLVARRAISCVCGCGVTGPGEPVTEWYLVTFFEPLKFN
jgi:hypothetical protein